MLFKNIGCLSSPQRPFGINRYPLHDGDYSQIVSVPCIKHEKLQNQKVGHSWPLSRLHVRGRHLISNQLVSPIVIYIVHHLLAQIYLAEGFRHDLSSVFRVTEKGNQINLRFFVIINVVYNKIIIIKIQYLDKIIENLRINTECKDSSGCILFFFFLYYLKSAIINLYSSNQPSERN